MSTKQSFERSTQFDKDKYSSSAVIAKSHKARRKKRIIVVVSCIVALFLLAGCAFAAYVSQINNKLTKGDKTTEELEAIESAIATSYETSLNEPFYMMLIGTDKRVNDESMGARSDTNIIVRVDPTTYTATLVSIPRDTKIEIEGYGTQKFNAAYAFNGAAGAIEAAEELLDIEISHYAEVNFGELANLIDAIGGVTVTVEEGEGVDDEKCDDYDGNHYVIEEGEQTLTGAEALTFSRSRQYPTGDFIRQKHQRQVIEAVANKITSLSIDKIPGVVSAACDCVTTDLNVLDIIGLAQKFSEADEVTIYSAMLPSYTQNINGISFVINDTDLTKEMMQKVAAGEDPSGIVSTTTASDISDGSVDTSQTILFSDDDYYTQSYDDTSSTQYGDYSGSSYGGAYSSGDGSAYLGQDNVGGGSSVSPDIDSESNNVGDSSGGFDSSVGGEGESDISGVSGDL
jgi:LCP family protein required for cell wall assembly